ncbi:type II secretion system protein [Gemmata sp. G18]|uniref:Type II secretion system protein n=1 Tax=Gemmata palustris TaxID=2822762 RepID=A0ABS5BXV8_9BACT|nr:type II secretion system protein [Gemmata palustris]MBP3958493.1 type II secretion system protein [Gemmata palustris]
MTRTNTRAGFTLIELLVAMAIITTLAGFILLVYPGARDQDRARNAVSDVEITLRMAQGMAARDKAPRGVRFIAAPTDLIANPARTSTQFVTELQYIELPPPLIPNLKPLVNQSSNPNSIPNLEAEPRVKFEYTLGPTGAIQSRRCIIENLTEDQYKQVQLGGCTVVMPNFGFWSKITAVPLNWSIPPLPAPQPANPKSNGRTSALGLPLSDLEVTLEVYPDAVMGGGTLATTNYFAIYLPATPLVGEPTVLIPKNICVDMSVSFPSATGDFDVMFGPDGKLIENSNGVIFLWVRDYTKTPTMAIPAATDGNLLTAFRRGGDQYIISVRSSGAIGHNQPLWPEVAPGPTFGTYATGQNQFSLVRQELNN